MFESGWIPAHRRLWTDVVRRALPRVRGGACIPARLAAWQSGHGAMQARATAVGSDSGFAEAARVLA